MKKRIREKSGKSNQVNLFVNKLQSHLFPWGCNSFEGTRNKQTNQMDWYHLKREINGIHNEAVSKTIVGC